MGSVAVQHEEQVLGNHKKFDELVVQVKRMDEPLKIADRMKFDWGFDWPRGMFGGRWELFQTLPRLLVNRTVACRS